METTLKFRKQFTIADFKSANNGNKIEIIKNPKTSKVFFVCGSVNGKVSKKGYAEPVISECTDGTETFYMLHSKNTANILDTL